jgi:hypothetical protein
MIRGFYLGVLLLGGCAAASSKGEPPARKESDPPPLGIQAASPEMEAIVKELLRGRTPLEQQKILESDRQYQIALAHFNRGDFERARDSAREAVADWPENLAARALLSDIYSILVGSPSPSIPDREVRMARVATEQAQIEIALHLVHGERYFGAGMFESALREFESAELKIRLLPYDVPAMNEILPKVKEWISRARGSRRDGSSP